MGLASGTRLGPFEILSPLGAGGMGEVYRARDTRLGREVAVKVMAERMVDDPKALARFEREAKAVASLSHPNVLALYDYGHEGDLTYAVMELLQGETLQQALKQGPLPVSKAVEVAKQIAGGLSAAHEKGIVHRDLKPANVFLTKAGHVKILDFGLARMEKPSLPGGGNLSQEATADLPTGLGVVMGTVGYMSPEQVRGQMADARADIFAFGVVLYEMLSGKKAFVGDTASDSMAAILMKDPDPLPPVTPQGLDRIVRRCLEKRPEDRFSTTHDVVLALETVSTTGGSRILNPPSEGWLRQHWIASAVAVAALVLVAALFTMNVGGFREKWFGGDSPAVSIRSIAVLPLANVSGDREQEFFSDGMTDELITHLSKIAALKVISRTSVMQYKDTKKPLKEIANELGVDGIVEGSVLRSGNKVRVTAQLIDASTDTHVWAESCERDLQDILSLQGEVARTIAGAVNVAVTPQERERLSGARRVNPEAYEACLKGNSYWMKLTPQDTEAARPYFERAIEIDPECVQAYRGLAWYWIVRMQMGRSAPGEAGPKAKAAALRAIALDEACAEAHEALAAVRTGVDWDWPGAEREWLRALEINPGAANAHAYYADFLASLGRVDEALPHIERAIELDPANALFQGIYAGVLVYARRYDDALAAADKAMALQPNIAPAATARRWVYGIKGMREEQLAQQRKQISYDPERLAAFDKGLAEGGYKGARLAIAELWIKRVEKGSAGPGKGILPAFQVCSIADRYFDAGDDKQAMDWLEKAYDARDPNLRYEIRCPVWDPLHSNPRFQALARKMNIPLEAAK